MRQESSSACGVVPPPNNRLQRTRGGTRYQHPIVAARPTEPGDIGLECVVLVLQSRTHAVEAVSRHIEIPDVPAQDSAQLRRSSTNATQSPTLHSRERKRES